MPIITASLNKKLYDLLKVRGYDPIPKDSTGQTTPVPDDAEVFKFKFKKGGEPVGDVWTTIDSSQNLVVYYDDDVSDSDEQNTSGGQFTDSWIGLIQHLKSWAQRRQLSFELKNKNHLSGDMAQRAHMKKEEQMNEGIVKEGYYPMGKKASYSDNVPSVKIVLQHTRQVEEGEQRFRNVAKIFLENEQGERILAPTTRPGIARIYARHLAEGGMPHDDRWNHVGSLVEEYTKMAGFVRATRNGQFNESAQALVEKGVAHYQALRESLGKMTGHRGYNAYFESWAPPLMEDNGDTSNLSELFVQENLDPRIESVMPILSRLHKPITEMTEVVELAEWADSITETEEGYGDYRKGATNPDGESTGSNFVQLNGKNIGQIVNSQDEGYGFVDFNKDTGEGEFGFEGPKAARAALLARYTKPVSEEESLTSNNPQGIPEDLEEDEDSDERCQELSHLKHDSVAMRDPALRSEVLRKSKELGCGEDEQIEEAPLRTVNALVGYPKLNKKVAAKGTPGSEDERNKAAAGLRRDRSGLGRSAYTGDQHYDVRREETDDESLAHIKKLSGL